ncbi:MAG: HAMP domain-containing sensor histidine kinase [Bdellovibrionota bacterium]
MLRQDKWRAWDLVGLNEFVNVELNDFKDKMGLEYIKVIPVSDIPIALLPEDIVVPNLQLKSKMPVFNVVFAKLDTSRLISTQVPNKEFLTILFLCALLFLGVIIYSASYVVRKIHQPIHGLGMAFEALEKSGSFETGKIKASGEMKDFIQAVDKIYKRSIESERTLALGHIATQVAHDIRSPLAALAVVTGSLQNLPDDARKLICEATGRIRTIANDLLNYSKKGELVESEVLDLQNYILEIVQEKKLEWKNRTKTKIIFTECPSRIQHPTKVLKNIGRIVSNVLNNAIESIQHDNGLVTIGVNSLANGYEIFISDNGCGIPDSLIRVLGEVQVKSNKEGDAGSGVALYYAKKYMISIGGDLNIKSSLGKGSRVSLFLKAKELS